MKIVPAVFCGVFLVGAGPFAARADDPPSLKSGPAPIYRVTVTERTTKAINYEYRSLPTMIDFRGTVLLPKAKGEAMVESKRGRTQIDAKLENLPAPSRFGREYLTYVLWAITPEGAPHNLGEVVPNGSDNAKLHVTTDLQAFGLIVTAEPYAAIRQPSDVVVVENEVRPDTVGKILTIDAKYELMPRGHYVLDLQAQQAAAAEAASGPKISMDRYEAQLQIYEAQNAIQIARAANADRYAPEILQKADRLMSEAQGAWNGKGSTRMIVQDAREAAQTAEDARVVAERRLQEERIAAATAEVARAEQAKAQAQAQADQALAQASAAEAEAANERAARERSVADALGARPAPPPVEAPAPPPPPPPPPAQPDAAAQKSELRARLLGQLNAVLPTLDSPRGLVVTVGDAHFAGSDLHAEVRDQLGRVAGIVTTRPGLRVEVDGNSDDLAGESMALRRAEDVRSVLVDQGVPSSQISMRNFGTARPVAANTTGEGRERNRRVEIVISGDPLGTLASWDRTYGLTKR